jgi:hypothetical protein
MLVLAIKIVFMLGLLMCMSVDQKILIKPFMKLIFKVNSHRSKPGIID